MRTNWGVVLICLGTGVALAVGALLRTRVSRTLAIVLLAASGIAVGAGALMVQAQASAAEWALTLVCLGVMAPFQARLIFGRLGKTVGSPSGTVVPD